MASKKDQECGKKEMNKGCWTSEEDKKLFEVVQTHGAKRWRTIATIAGLNRCGKSCRLRWLNYLRPNIKRGNITDQEEDLIIRLHKLLGNRWSLIAGRIPGRTDNEIKNYWNSNLSKRIDQAKNQVQSPSGDGSIKKRRKICNKSKIEEEVKEDETSSGDNNVTKFNTDGDDFFDFSNENPLTLEWVSRFLDKSRTEVPIC